MLWDHCLSVLSVCIVDVLWPNGWMGQDETWRGGRPRPWPHGVRSSSSSPKGSQPPNFHPMSVVAKRLDGSRMPLRTKVGLGPGHIVLDGDPTPPYPTKRGAQPPIFAPSVVAKRSPISATAEHLFVLILCCSIFVFGMNVSSCYVSFSFFSISQDWLGRTSPSGL